ncbi:hypothetical protein BKA69DRAFT_1042412 [Paraphysoderma sedebokerense]|nr:hypothetical protein BKA69DRAFT_1042412 [Paraphysoderma sedebokerense]
MQQHKLIRSLSGAMLRTLCLQISMPMAMFLGRLNTLWWIPYDDKRVADFLQSLKHFVNTTKTPSGEETIRVKLTMAGWGNVGVAPICVNSTTPCPYPRRTLLLWVNGVNFCFINHCSRLVTDPSIVLRGDAGEPFWKEWTWEVFTDYAIRIKNHYMVNGTGFRLPTAWDEEFYIFQTMLRNYGVSFVDPATWKCGLRNPQSVSAVKNIIKKLFIDEMAVDLEGLYSNDVTFTNWTKAGLLNPLDNPLLCCAVWCF